MRAHEAVGARDEARAALVDVARSRGGARRARSSRPDDAIVARHRCRVIQQRHRSAVRSGLRHRALDRRGQRLCGSRGRHSLAQVWARRKDRRLLRRLRGLRRARAGGERAARRRAAAVRAGPRPTGRLGREVGAWCARARGRRSCRRSPSRSRRRTRSPALLTGSPSAQHQAAAAAALARPGGRRADLCRASPRARSRRSTTTATAALGFGARRGRRARRDRRARRPRRAAPSAGGSPLNGAVALGVPLAVLVARGGRRPARARRPAARLRELAEGVALPFALQGLYVIGYRFASGLGDGHADDLLLRLPDRRAARRRDGDARSRSSRRCRSRATS